MKQRIKFISYDGKFPNLCSGILVFSINDVEYKVSYALTSGGCTYFTNDYQDEHIESGEWSIDFDNKDFKDIPLTEDDKIVLTKLVNDNVDYGCCGGCL